MSFHSLVLSFVVVCCTTTVASAKGFFATEPEDEVELRYEGTVTQTEYDSFGGSEEFAFDRVVTIRAFGPERTRRAGENVEAWWVELEVETGTATERGIDTGPGGRVVYAALIAADQFGAARGGSPSHVPVLRGFRRIDDGPVEELPDGVLRLDPVFTMRPDLRPDEVTETEETTVNVPAGRFSATRVAGEVVVETLRVRVRTESTLETGPDVPIGPLAWTVRLDRFDKESTKPRDEFRLVTEQVERMQLVEIGTALSMELDVADR